MTYTIGSGRALFPEIRDFRTDHRTAWKPEHSTPQLSNQKEVAQ